MSNTPSTLNDDSELEVERVLRHHYEQIGNSIEDEDYDYNTNPFMVSRKLVKNLTNYIHQRDKARDRRLSLTESQVEQAAFNAKLMSDYPNYIRVLTQCLNEQLTTPKKTNNN